MCMWHGVHPVLVIFQNSRKNFSFEKNVASGHAHAGAQTYGHQQFVSNTFKVEVSLRTGPNTS